MQTFHPSSRHWIFKITWIILLAIPAIYFTFKSVFICAFWPIMFLGINLMNLYFLKHTILKMDEQKILFQRGKFKVQILWKDVLMVRQTKQTWNQINLELATYQKVFVVPLQYFDIDQVWYWVKHYAPVSAFQENAYKQLSAYQKWATKSQELINNHEQTLRARYSFGTLIMIGFALVSLTSIGSILWLALNSIDVILCLSPIIFVLGKLIASTIFYRLEMTAEGITTINLRKKEGIKWAEITHIDHDYGQHRFVFYGQNKRLATPGPQLLVGKDRKDMIHMLQAQIEYRQLKLHRTERALFIRSQNVTIN